MTTSYRKPIQVIDSHTGGEPTRCVIAGGPDLGSGSVAERCEAFRTKFDRVRSAIVDEPRGSEVIVGALLCEPDNPESATGVIYFNNISTLHMCGHATIGLAVTLAHQGKIRPGHHGIDTPVGRVGFELHEDRHHVTIRNVPSYRYRANVAVDVPNVGRVVGDIAWGGNWFFLVDEHNQRLEASRTRQLTEFTLALRRAIEANHITGENGGLIDHLILYGSSDQADSKNFVLCPGGAYDRSPCGTGTSAKMACLAADGKLAPGESWRQESIIGSIFEGSYRLSRGDSIQGTIIPSITGSAWVTSEATLFLDPTDPFQFGFAHD